MMWKELGQQIAAEIKSLTDEDAIAAIAKNALDQINQRPNPQERKSALDSLARPIRKLFPNCAENPNSPVYRETGKSAKRWRHVIFDYLTLSQTDYDSIDPNRKEWREQQKQQEKQVPPTEPITQEQSRPQIEITVGDIMNISQLELDTETQKMVEDAIARTNISLPDFLKKACMVYAKTLVKKAEVSEADLAAVPTEELLNNKKYQTHPSRAPELTKRAVIAIKKHNASVTETSDRWHITQSAITRLTGSRPGAVAKALEQFQDDILQMEDLGLNAYSNRKGKNLEGNPREIENEINLVGLVPDGFTQ